MLVMVILPCQKLIKIAFKVILLHSQCSLYCIVYHWHCGNCCLFCV